MSLVLKFRNYIEFYEFSLPESKSDTALENFFGLICTRIYVAEPYFDV